MQDFLTWSASQLCEKIRNKELSSTELVQAQLDWVIRINPILNAVEQLHIEQALQQAKQADNMLAKGKVLGKLHGLPVSFKDTAPVQGFDISRGCKALLQKQVQHDCTVAKRLRDAGAIIFALTNVPELLMAYETDNTLYGCTNNPYDLTRTPGGSSGGEAALIAACGSPLGIGSDFGGSVRQPAHNCGITSIKPTQMLVSNASGLGADTAGLILNIATLGPMARYVDDLRLAMDIISGPDGYDPFVPPVKIDFYKTIDIKKLRVNYFFSDGHSDVDADTLQTLTNVVAALKSEVHTITEHQAECLKDIYRVHFGTTIFSDHHGEITKSFFKNTAEQEISTFVKQTIKLLEQQEMSVNQLRTQLMEAQRFPYKMMHAYHAADVIICPVTITPAMQHGTHATSLANNTLLQLFNIAGWPAVVVRCGTNKAGLPIGVQIAAKPWHDDVALAVAKRLEEIFGGYKVPDFSWLNSIAPIESNVFLSNQGS